MLPPILNLLEADYHPLLIVGVGQGNLHDTLLSGIRFELVSSLGLSKSANPRSYSNVRWHRLRLYTSGS